MITTTDVPQSIVNLLPAMKNQLPPEVKMSKNCSPAAIQSLTDFTRRMVTDHNTAVAAECFAAAEKLYAEGDSKVKNEVDNIFV